MPTNLRTTIERNGIRDRAAWHVVAPDLVLDTDLVPAGPAREKLAELSAPLNTKLRAKLRARGLSSPGEENPTVADIDSSVMGLRSRVPNAGSFLVGKVSFRRLAGLSPATARVTAPIIAMDDPRLRITLRYVTYPKPGVKGTQAPPANAATSSGGGGGGEPLIILEERKATPTQKLFIKAGGQISLPVLPVVQEIIIDQFPGESVDAMLDRAMTRILVPGTLNAEVSAKLDAQAAKVAADAAELRLIAERDEQQRLNAIAAEAERIRLQKIADDARALEVAEQARRDKAATDADAEAARLRRAADAAERARLQKIADDAERLRLAREREVVQDHNTVPPHPLDGHATPQEPAVVTPLSTMTPLKWAGVGLGVAAAIGAGIAIKKKWF